jgi:hypothetical protein
LDAKDEEIKACARDEAGTAVFGTRAAVEGGKALLI